MKLKIVYVTKAAKIPSWPLFYSLKMNDVKSGFEETMKHSESYLNDARSALEELQPTFHIENS